MPLFASLVLLSAVALADEPPGPVDAPAPVDEGAVVDPATAPFALVLEHAKDLFVRGNHREALTAFDALHARFVAGEAPPEALLVEALLYRGEVQYKLGDVVASWDTFKEALLRDPTLVMSPYHHHAEVVEQFEVVKRAVQLEIAARPKPLPPPKKRLPVWGYLPLGVPQLAQRQPVRGVVYGTLQLGFAITSIAMYDRLGRLNGPHNPYGIPDRDVPTVVQRERFAVQWPATVLAWSFLAVSLGDGAARWRATHGGLRLQVSPDPTRPGAVLGGSF